VTDTATTRPVDPSLISYTHWMYALHAVAAVIGISTAAFIATAFVFSIPSIIAVIMNYVKRNDVRGTWLDSHFSWQLRTFWWAALWIVVVSVISFPLILLLGLGLVTMWIGISLVGLWILYRVIRGWLALKDRRAI
jgi:uncharacterized membrane protein